MSPTSEAGLLSSGLQGEMGWADSDESSWGPMSSALLLTATGLYFGSTWMMAGLDPLARLAIRFASRKVRTPSR